MSLYQCAKFAMCIHCVLFSCMPQQGALPATHLSSSLMMLFDAYSVTALPARLMCLATVNE